MTLTEVVKMFDIRESDFIYFTIHKEYKFTENMQLCNIRKSLDDEEYRQKMREEIIKRAKRKRTEINKYWEK